MVDTFGRTVSFLGRAPGLLRRVTDFGRVVGNVAPADETAAEEQDFSPQYS